MSTPTNAEIHRLVAEAVGRYGIVPCRDNSCIFGPTGGMGTNGGCRCVMERFPGQRQDDRMLIQKLAKVVRELAARVAERP